MIVDNYDARRRRGYNGDLLTPPRKRSLRCGDSVVEQQTSRPLLWPCHAVFKVRRGRHRRDSPAGLSKLSSTRPPRAQGARRAPGPVDVLDAPDRQEATEPALARELPRKEVIQPHLPVLLPCYDFVPIAGPTLDGCLPPGVSPPASGVSNFHDVTGGVYKARERIHPDVADSGLLATPPSWRRVSASNPNRDRLFGIRSTSRYRSPLYRPM